MNICYEIRVHGHISAEWKVVFEDMEMICLADGDTTLTGLVPDQAALFGLLLRLRDLGLTLVSVKPA